MSEVPQILRRVAGAVLLGAQGGSVRAHYSVKALTF